ncbi:MAG: DUF1830 domain-containing protein [Chroococcales cyanobacterium]
MAQILDPIPNDEKPIYCGYVNGTSQIQVVRITNIANWYFERVVFPGQRLIFEALPEAMLEIHTGMMASAILSDKIPCSQLNIQEASEPEILAEETTEKEAIAEPRTKVAGIDSKSRLNFEKLQTAAGFC